MNINTAPLNFQMTPGQVQRQRLISRMYDVRNTRGPYFYGTQGITMSGLRGLGGLGSTDVSNLAAAMVANQIHPQFISTNTWHPPWLTGPETLPAFYYVDDATAQQIAGALGGSVVKQHPSVGVTGGNDDVPLANFIRLPDGTLVNAADVAQVANLSISVPDMSILCGTEKILAMNIPGASVGSDCAANPNTGYVPQYGTPGYQPPATQAPPTSQAPPATGSGSSTTTPPTGAPGSSTQQPQQPATQQQPAPQQTQQQTAPATDNTLLYVGLGVGALLLVMSMGGHK